MTEVVSQRELVYRNRTFQFLVASLLIHILMMMLLSKSDVLLSFFRKDTAATPPVDVEFVQMTKEQMEKLTRQIVETTQAEKSEKATPDAYLGAQTQTVQRQTRAANTSPFRDGKNGGAQGKQKTVIGDLGVHMNFKPMGNLGPGEMPSTSDHLNNVQNGAQTLLNTKEFAYFSFYQRVRKQLEQYWEPGLRQRLKTMFERGRQLAADHEHSTRILVVLNSEGLITNIQVQGTSGLLDLDQAAIEAFNRAGPFPNPPRGLVENDGTVKVEWEFILKT